MPTPGYDYQSWMLAEVKALEKAVADRASRPKSCDAQARATAVSQDDPRGAGRGRAAVRAHDPRSGELPDRARRVHGADRIKRGGKDDAVPGDPRPAGGERGTRARWQAAHREHGRRHRPIGYVPQKFLLDPDVPLRARDLVGLGIDAHRLGVPRPSRTRRALVEEMLARGRRRALRRHARRQALRRRAAAHPDRARADRPPAAAAPR